MLEDLLEIPPCLESREERRNLFSPTVHVRRAAACWQGLALVLQTDDEGGVSLVLVFRLPA